MFWLAVAVRYIGKELGNARLNTVMDECFSAVARQQLLPKLRLTTCQENAAVVPEYVAAEQGKLDD